MVREGNEKELRIEAGSPPSLIVVINGSRQEDLFCARVALAASEKVHTSTKSDDSGGREVFPQV